MIADLVAERIDGPVEALARITGPGPVRVRLRSEATGAVYAYRVERAPARPQPSRRPWHVYLDDRVPDGLAGVPRLDGADGMPLGIICDDEAGGADDDPMPGRWLPWFGRAACPPAAAFGWAWACIMRAAAEVEALSGPLSARVPTVRPWGALPAALIVEVLQAGPDERPVAGVGGAP